MHSEQAREDPGTLWLALAMVGATELAPYVAQVAWLLPRWLMPALAGLLLVVAGATYERRLEEARRLKRAWQRLG